MGEAPADAEPVSAESDEAAPVEGVEGVDDSEDEPLGGVVTTVPSVGVDADEPEVFVPDPDVDSTGVDELDPADADDVAEPDEVFDPVEVDDESDGMAGSAGCDDVDPDEVVLVDVVSFDDDDGGADSCEDGVDGVGELVVEVCCSDSVSVHEARRFLREYRLERAVEF